MSHRFPEQAQEMECEVLRFPKQVQKFWREFHRVSDKGQETGCVNSGIRSVAQETERIIGFMISLTNLISLEFIEFASDFLLISFLVVLLNLQLQRLNRVEWENN